MAVGQDVNKATLDRALAVAFNEFKSGMDRIGELKYYLDTKTTGDLEAMGYTPTEAGVLKSAMADAGQFISIFEGGASLGSAKDFRTFIRQVWGLGVTV